MRLPTVPPQALSSPPKYTRLAAVMSTTAAVFGSTRKLRPAFGFDAARDDVDDGDRDREDQGVEHVGEGPRADSHGGAVDHRASLPAAGLAARGRRGATPRAPRGATRTARCGRDPRRPHPVLAVLRPGDVGAQPPPGASARMVAQLDDRVGKRPAPRRRLLLEPRPRAPGPEQVADLVQRDGVGDLAAHRRDPDPGLAPPRRAAPVGEPPAGRRFARCRERRRGAGCGRRGRRWSGGGAAWETVAVGAAGAAGWVGVSLERPIGQLANARSVN